MKKKILSVLATMFLGAALTLGFSACKGDDSNEDILSSVHSEQSESVGGGNNTSDGGNSGDGNIEEEGSSDGASSHEHSYTAVITEPTCLVGGYTTYTCACGNTYQADYVDALEHLNEGGYCSRCDTGETHSSYFTFTLLDDDTYSITAKDGNNIPNNIKLPSEYEGKKVTAIGEGAFLWCSSLTSVVIPDSVTSIGNSAFSYCTGLTSITVGENNTAYQSIDGNLYSKDGSVLIQYAIGKTATDFVIPECVTSIGESAFYDCDSLTSVVIPNSVTSIGSYVFEYCSSLTSIMVGENNTAYQSIDGNLYTKDGSVLIQYAIGKTATEFAIPEGVTEIGSSAFNGCSSLTSVVIGDGVTTIGGFAFQFCSSLTSVVIGDSVTTIGSSAFQYCFSLTSVVIGDGVTTIGDYAFDYCSSLTSIMVGQNNTAYQSIDGNLYSKDGSVLMQYAIGKTATEFVIPECVTSIGDFAFYNCSSLTSIEIPDSVTSIGRSAFASCSSLTSVTIGDSVTSIGSSAFQYCFSLTSVVIGDSVTSIGNYAFGACDSLTIYCEVESKPIEWDYSWSDYNSAVVWDYKHNNIATDGYIYVIVDGLRYALKDGEATVARQPRNLTTANIPEGITYKDVEYSVTTIGSYAFKYCSSLTSVVIGDSVTMIAGGAFYDCSNLTSVEFGDSVASIASFSFSSYSKLTEIKVSENNTAYQSIDGNLYSKDGSVLIQYAIGKTATEFVIPEGVTTIGSSAFSNCSSLTSVVIGDSVTSIGSGAFYSCSSLTSITVGENNTAYQSIDGNLYSKDGSVLIQYAIGKTATEFVIPDSVTTIGNSAFSHCTGLTSVEIPDSVTTIGNYAFYDCDGLTSVVIPDSVTTIGFYVFNYCSSLTSVVIGDSVTTIGDYAFSNCDSLTSVVIGDSVTGIGWGAFSGCDSLTSVVIGDSVTGIGWGAFSDCYSLTSVVIPDSVTTIGNFAFNYCHNLTIYCEAESQPSGWDADWNFSNRPVYWGWKEEN